MPLQSERAVMLITLRCTPVELLRSAAFVTHTLAPLLPAGGRPYETFWSIIQFRYVAWGRLCCRGKGDVFIFGSDQAARQPRCAGSCPALLAAAGGPVPLLQAEVLALVHAACVLQLPSQMPLCCRQCPQPQLQPTAVPARRR